MRDSFGRAIDGLGHLLRTQRSFRIHVAAAVAVLVAAALLRFSPGEWAVLLLTIALVVTLEGLNTDIEIAVTLASGAPAGGEGREGCRRGDGAGRRDRRRHRRRAPLFAPHLLPK